jgi:alpha-glucosidase
MTVETLEARMPHGWPCWAISNHDVARAVTRWGGGGADAALARQLVALVCSLRGSVCLYQGEELGLTEAEVAFEDLQDPYGIAFWPNFKGRDGCRTPMPWTDAPTAGFTDRKPWLPIPDAHRAHSVAAQDADDASVLNHVRRFLHWRKQQPALLMGDIAFLDAPEPVLAFVRRDGDAAMLVVFNLSDAATSWPLPAAQAHAAALEDAPVNGARIVDGRVQLPPRGVLYARV